MSQREILHIIIDVCKALYNILSQIKKKVLSGNQKMSSFKGILTLALAMFVLVSIAQESHACSKGKGGSGSESM